MLKVLIGVALLMALNVVWIFGGWALAKHLRITGSWSTYVGQLVIWAVSLTCGLAGWLVYTYATQGYVPTWTWKLFY